MSDAPEPPALDPAERRVLAYVAGGVFGVLFVLEILAGRGVDLLLILFNLVVAGVVAFVTWLVRDTLRRRAARRGDEKP